jgi:large subunit ribosomal protein LP2|mmetsp:Transcript_19076/g.25826  ORF Transcript_19076/g.25826 Transcript_19076/m.25826 type:complete len:107 (+) Transcript_19076:67-387(+)|eukprot:CAMPEP_0185566670 /NCGR_PEP_ID=MMETSP0434-20130131/34_1 /TAXON_ID=626734 ORGANISM="Favella taraikaensis, Strain Fe Narragansett Bay" /NCGR_SAMPLE_ID=MMETSP0434 /ASSEMBLY_ACC=CAM_ASM_000379 /LENGTH=106 /DNA_ID=CAMNT_0028180627 /DNA_START=49 /DNA_END=369 /DNA_ORIENTATION=-
MRHIAAYALLVLGGKDAPTAADVEKVVKDAGAEADKEKIAALVEALAGKPFNEIVAAGIAKLGSMGTAAKPAAVAGAPATEAKKEEAPEPEEDVDIGGMFGDEDDY